MGNISDEERTGRFLAALPKNGRAVGNTSLARKLGWPLDSYFKIRNEILLTGKIEIGRGRGGSVRLAGATVGDSSETVTPPDRKPRQQRERSLYPAFLESLATWAKGQGWTDHVIEQTSDQGARRTGGRFSRPDFVVIGVKKYEYTPGVVRDLESFEVKPLGANIESVFETAAHSRVATKSFLALHVAPDYPPDDELGRIESECQRFGLGLITFEKPDFLA